MNKENYLCFICIFYPKQVEVVDGLERDDDHSDRDDHDDHQSEHSDQDQGQGDHEEGKCSAVHLLSFNLFCSSFMHPLDT